MQESQNKTVAAEGISFQERAREYFTTKKMVYVAVFSALSVVLYMFVKFPLPIFPAFLDFQVSDVPALICAFMFGSLAGCTVVVVKILIKLPFTMTAGIGELCDLSLGLTFVLSVSLVYRYLHSNKGAAIGLSLGVLTTTLVAMVLNRFVIVPAYAFYIPGGWDTILKMTRAVGEVVGVYGSVTRDSFFSIYLPFAVLPFNLLRGTANALLGFFLYHGLQRADKRLFMPKGTHKVLPQSNQAETAEESRDNPVATDKID